MAWDAGRQGKRIDVMLDLETMAVTPDAAVASIGACAFVGTERMPEDFKAPEKFHVVVDLRPQSRVRRFDGDTVYWWLRQTDKARTSISVAGALHPALALQRFSDWYLAQSVNGVRARAWANGASFDHSILDSLYEHVGHVNPIHFTDRLCLRSISSVVEGADGLRPSFGTQHNALDDSISQAVWLNVMLGKLR